jgi:uncharacterized protein (DUF2384 family)
MRVVNFEALHALANDTFATPEEAFDWERRQHPLLGGKTPLECATSPAGAMRVRDLLLAIKHGIVM